MFTSPNFIRQNEHTLDCTRRRKGTQEETDLVLIYIHIKQMKKDIRMFKINAFVGIVKEKFNNAFIQLSITSVTVNVCVLVVCNRFKEARNENIKIRFTRSIKP